jgi:hypothetical protein
MFLLLSKSLPAKRLRLLVVNAFVEFKCENPGKNKRAENHKQWSYFFFTLKNCQILLEHFECHVDVIYTTSASKYDLARAEN